MDSIFVYKSPETTDMVSGDLTGVKIAIQPNISAAGWPTEAGSKALTNYKALEDATLVKRLRQAGACLYGSTRMSEFGFGLEASQAGEAVRQKTVDVELVLDMMGESRLAASRTAVCGFKPSYGLVSRYGLVGLIPSMECCGILSGNIKNIRSILKTAAGPDELDFSLPDEEFPDFSQLKFSPQKMTLGVIKEAVEALPLEQISLFHESLEKLRKAGLVLKDLSLPEYSLFHSSICS